MPLSSYEGNEVTVDYTLSGSNPSPQWVFGGYSSSDHVTDNKVFLKNGTMSHSVYGGHSDSGSVTGNTVVMSGGSVGGALVGGSGNGSVTGNTVIMSGGSVSVILFGGHGNDDGSATGNTVAISGNANISSVQRLYGGNAPSGTGDIRTGNTLYIDSWKGNTQANIANFENYRFTLPASVSNGTNILTTTGNVTLSSSSGQQTTVALDFTGKPAALRPGDEINLIAANAITKDSNDPVNTSFTSTFAATDYLFDIGLKNSDKTMTATFRGTQVNQKKAQTYLYGAAARLTSLVNGADHMISIMDNWKHTLDPATPLGFRSFASIQGNTIETRTGSSVKDHGASFALGGAFDTATQWGTLTAGVFIEGGLGGYESDTSSGQGNGDTWHAGIGAFAKHAFANRVYLEGAVRAGRAKTDFEGKGDIATLRYDSRSNYWGAHVGVGVDHPLNEAASMDLYGKVLWTHQDSDTVKTYAAERLSFDGANSLRSRIGARYRYVIKKDLRAHAGVGWEYEFDGKERAKLDGTRITHTPETRGHSALIEAGVEWTATKGWSFDANVTAMGGQRKGVSGFLQAKFRF